MATFQEKITSYTGFTTLDATTTPTLDVAVDVLNRAIMDILKIVPEGLFLKYLTVETDNDSAGMVLTTRGTAADHIYRLFKGSHRARLVDTTEFKRAGISNSLYTPTGLEPIYAVGATAATSIDVLPSGDPTSYYQVLMPALTDLTGSFLTAAAVAGVTTGYGPVPPEAEDAVILTAAIKLMHIKLDQAVEEEDGELVNVTQAEIAALDKLYQLELARLLENK
jgi:hypothetical protein